MNGEIADYTTLLATMLIYLRDKEMTMAYTTTAFDAECAERTIVNNLQSPEEAHILRENIRYWLSSRHFALDLLSNTVEEVGPNFLSPAIACAVLKGDHGKTAPPTS